MRFEDVFGTTLITLAGEVDETMIRSFDKTLKDVHADPRLDNRAIILLTTYGGASGYAFAMYERLRLAQRVFDLSIVGIGLVYSHGVSMMMALPKDKRFVTAGTRVYIHELQKESELALKGPHGARRRVLEQELRTFDEERVTLEWTVNVLSEGTGRAPKEIRRLMRKGHYLGGRDAVEFGIAGALVEEEFVERAASAGEASPRRA